MPKDYQSIEDLINSSEGQPVDGDGDVQAKFQEKEKEIRIKELERLTEKKAASMSLPYLNLVGFSTSVEALVLIKEEEARELNLVCFYYDGKKINLASTDPQSPEVKKKTQFLEEKYFCQVSLYLVSKHSLDYVLGLYKMLSKVREITKVVKISEEDLKKYSRNFSTFRDLQKQISKTQITDIVTLIMAASIKSEASDIHIEAEEQEIKVRFRIDGILHDAAILKKDLWKKIISRLKILSGVKINIIDRPQDGRISIYTKEERIDIRASFLPTNYGESVALRILRSGFSGLAFEELGLRKKIFDQLKHEVERPNGMIITTGPTGSGKTTTLYAILKKLKKEETKIITIEDPIEYQLAGINQSQAGKNYTFAQALRYIVRQDPDIIMVGEIRDLETAEIAIQASLTGHLVLSTLHTNDAAGAIPRFLSMGVKPFLLSPAINAIIGQRLVRKICKLCKTEDNIEESKLIRIKKILEKLPDEYKNKIDFNNLKFYKGLGCDSCQGIGYKGRIGIFEIMSITSEVEKLVLSGKVSEYDMRESAMKNGMIIMVQDGLLKAIEGITSVDEILRVAEEKE